ncbi:MAG TPA: NAD-dependent deacylase, partial [Thermodesulfobacteriota bacterium]|nr:NAD-dependent deacylase [Thermodesulfobacteriota bacterium]
MEEEIQRAKDILNRANGVTVLTGAGISAESGIPTFRGEDGLWKRYNPEDVDTADAFRRNPMYVWEWYNGLRELISKKEPNPGHYALSRLERIKPYFSLITQNVDDLHRVAGNTNIIEMHGNIWKMRCTECTYVEENRDVPLTEIPPRCKSCGGLLRPGVVWFEENIPLHIIDSCLLSIEYSDVMLIVGTSGMVEPAASMGLVAKHTGKTVIEVNLEESTNSKKYDL